MRYAVSRFVQHQRDLVYRISVTEGLRITTSFILQKEVKNRYLESLGISGRDKRSGEEIVEDVVTLMGLEVID